MNVLFAPDYRQTNPYQRLLAQALEQSARTTVQFLSVYRRGLPLARGARQFQPDILHLHWPEAYAANCVRQWRFPFDLKLACRQTPLVLTAHNLAAHDRSSGGIFRAYRNAHRHARAIIVHSHSARNACTAEFGTSAEKYHVIPHGDLSVDLPVAPERTLARQTLNLEARPTLLLFGRLAPYKGIEELLDAWPCAPGYWQLVIAGQPTAQYGEQLRARAARLPNVHIEAGWLDNARLALWLAASDAVICNYRRILTSGAAMLPRALGIPLLLPRSAATVELGEPDPRVLRFDDLGAGLPELLAKALDLGHDTDAAAGWRQLHSWQRIATEHARVYRNTLDDQ